MQTVLEANIGSVEISCPWCIHKYPFMTDLIVSESQIPEMFYKVKAAYERILYLQNYSSERVSELTRLQGQLIRDKKIFAAKTATVKTSVPKCRGQDVIDLTPEYSCKGEREHCPA
jgi:hypothetical protein